MKKSLFKLRSEFSIPLSFQFMEDLQRAVSDAGDDVTLFTLIAETLTNLFPEKSLTESEQHSVITRLEEWFKPQDGKVGDDKEPIKSLGTALSTYFVELKPDEICLFLTDFDIDAAETLYRYEDKEVVMAAYNSKTELEMQRLTANFEAGMYGFGGGYKEDPNVGSDDGDSDVVDLTKDGAEDGLHDLMNAFKGD